MNLFCNFHRHLFPPPPHPLPEYQQNSVHLVRIFQKRMDRSFATTSSGWPPNFNNLDIQTGIREFEFEAKLIKFNTEMQQQQTETLL